VPSSWIITRVTGKGRRRYQVRYRLGGRESQQRYGGSFKTKTEALGRKRWIEGELAARRVPDLEALEREPARAPTLAEAAESWRASRVDVVDQTGKMHRSAFVRIFRVRRSCALGALTSSPSLMSLICAALAEAGYRRETVRKSRTALAQTLDFQGVDPNPSRDGRVKLPRERRRHTCHLRSPSTSNRSLVWSHQHTCSRSRSSMSVARACRNLRRQSSAMLTRSAVRSVFDPTPRRTSATATFICRTISSLRSLPRCRRARTATRTLRSLQA
jgi:hypothetical protein